MTKLVGILNLSPDSFSGDGVVMPDQAMARLKQLIADGADVVDVGAESTRPDATALSPEAEWERLAPVLPQLVATCHAAGLPLSLDTRHASTAAQALTIGVDMINDVSGFADEAMIAAVKHSDCPLVVMHSLGVPANRSVTLAEGCDVVAEVVSWWHLRRHQLEQAGVARHRLICDPGIGFGKTAAQSLDLLVRVGELKAQIDAPLYIGHSRKSFLKLLGDETARDALTLAFSAMLRGQGVEYVRVHEVAAHRTLWQALS